MAQQQARTATQVTRRAMRRAADQFIQDHADDRAERSQSQLFWADFLAIFGRSARQAAVYEKAAKRASTGNTGFIDLLIAGEMGVEQKSRGESLDAAQDQLHDYLPDLTTEATPWLLLACDFGTFRWENLDDGSDGTFKLEELPDHLYLFEWLAGYGRPGEQSYTTDEAANLTATRLLAEVHDELTAVGYPAHDLRVWMTRLLFCLFADDSDVWPRGTFHGWLTQNTKADGTDLGPQMVWLHDLLNTAPASRPTNLAAEWEEFTYVNGALFDEPIKVAPCNQQVREAILKATRFEWAAISPAIFGSMFQQVMTPKSRRELGAHYTGETSILRAINSLFLEELTAELNAASSKPDLEKFLDKLGTLTFFDPACGCGNFLVVTYAELRKLETEALKKLLHKRGTGQALLDATTELKVKVDQFYGVDIEEFPVQIARTAMYLADHLANRKLLDAFGETYARFPIQDSPTIVHGNALTTDWNDILPAEGCDFVVGNPPFAGQKTRSAEQTQEMKDVWGDGYARWLDYVTCWYQLAFTYGRHRKTRFAFVSTNSITQGEQPSRLWTAAFKDGWRLDFGHRTFPWTSDAKGRAAVHVVIVGFSHRTATNPKQRHVVDYDSDGNELRRIKTKSVSPYLTAGPQLAVDAARKPLASGLPSAEYGNKPSDGGFLIVDPDELPEHDAVAMKYIKRYVGAKELTNGTHRYCIWAPTGPEPGDLRKSPWLADRIAAVRQFREESTAEDTQKMADRPYRFFRIPQPSTSYVGIPRHVSERRPFYTVRHYDPDVIASDAIYSAADPDSLLFALMSSSMYIAWMRTVAGRIKSDLRFSNSVTHNPFPLPNLSVKQRKEIIAAGKDVLKARPDGAALADLYNPNGMPPVLLDAHKQLDRVVDRILAPKRKFKTESDRAALLLLNYEKLLKGGQLDLDTTA